MKKTLLSLALAGLASVSIPASAIGTFNKFTVDESSVPGASANTFVADKINGAYNEVLTVNADLTFDTVAYADWGQYFKNDGSSLVGSQLNSFGVSGYGMYALFSSAGSVAAGFNGTSGSFSLYIDPLQDTTKTLPGTGTGSIALGGDSDDYLIASASNLINGSGLISPFGGFFNLIFDDFALSSGDQNAGTAGTQNGDLYFVDPRPFHLLVRSNGDFDTFTTPPGPGTYTNITGDISAVFAVPEPASLALMGLGLLGMGAFRRRKD